MTWFGHSNFFNQKPPTQTGHKLAGNGEQCCPPDGITDIYPVDFQFDTGTSILTITLNNGDTLSVDLSTLAIIDGNVSGVSYNAATGELTVTSTVGGPFTTTITSLPTTIANTVFVQANGNDVTGLRERVDKPFATPWAAVAAANAGDTVIVYAGAYTLGASGGTEKIVKDGVRVLLHPNAVLTFTALSTAQPFSDGGVQIAAAIQGWGSIVWQQAADMATASHPLTDMSIKIFSFNGGRILCQDYNSYHLDIDYVTCTDGILAIAPTLALSNKSLSVRIGDGNAGNAGSNVIRYAVGGGLVVTNCNIEFDVSLRIRNLTTPAILIGGIGGETKVVLNGKIVDTGGAQAGYLLELGQASDASNFRIDLVFDWSYGVLNIPLAPVCNASGTVRLVGNIEDHAPAADLDLRGSRAGLQVDINLNISGSTNTFGVIRANDAGNPGTRRTHIGGRIRSTGVVPPIYLDAAAAIQQYASLSHLTIFTNAASFNSAAIGPAAVQCQVNKVRCNKAVLVPLFTQQGEIVQVVATTLT